MMREKIHSYDIMSDRALEMIMVDVLDGMLESSLESGILNGSRRPTLLSLINTGTSSNTQRHTASPTAKRKNTPP